jgi:CHASE2 domain-containing sensor protein
MKAKRKSFILPLAVLLVVTTVTVLGAWERFEHMLYDGWFNLRGPQEPSGGVVIIAIDDPSVYELGFPVARDVHAQLLEKLAQAQVVAVDLLSDHLRTNTSRLSVARTDPMKRVLKPEKSARRLRLFATRCKNRPDEKGTGTGWSISGDNPAISFSTLLISQLTPGTLRKGRM